VIFSLGALFGYGLWNQTNKKSFKFQLISFPQSVYLVKLKMFSIIFLISYKPLLISLPTSIFFYFHKQSNLICSVQQNG